MLVETCKLTLIGKVTRIRPSIDKIRDDFVKSVQLKGSAKTGAYNMHHVFIDFDIEEDHRNVYGRNFLNICNMQMKLLKWETNFKPEAETTLSPVWINLPDLRWHFFEWDALCQIIAPIGVPIISDKATYSKSRPTTAKVKVEIDITRDMVTEIQIEVQNKDGSIEVINQRVEYENVPEYCFHCKAQGHCDA